MLFFNAAFSYSFRRLGIQSRNSRTSRSQPRGRSWATPPMRYQAGCIRKPVMASITLYARGQPGPEPATPPAPATGQGLGDAADAIPGRVHTEAGDGLDHLVRPLPVGEGEEHRGHGADVLDEGAQEQQVVLDTEELGHHDAD